MFRHFSGSKQQFLLIIQISQCIAVAALRLEGSIWIKAEELLQSGWFRFTKSVVHIIKFLYPQKQN